MWIKRNNPALDATKTPTVLDIAWAAGFFEGEGHPRLNYKRGVDLSVSQKDPEILYRLRDWFGGAVRFAKCKTVPADRQVYQWNACGDRARLFFALVYHSLSARRKAQIDATGALEFLRGISSEGLTISQLKDKLLFYYEQDRPNKSRSPEYRRTAEYRKYQRDKMRGYRAERRAKQAKVISIA